MLKKVGIVGHFAHGREFFDGQTIKTRTLTQTLQNELGETEVCTLDTYGGLKNIVKIVFGTFKMLAKCKNIIMLPAHNGLKLFVPLLKCLNYFFHRRLHYSVIGGWLPQYVQKHRFIGKLLKGFDFIYVETKAMKSQLEELGFKNSVVVPNFKNIEILSEEELVYEHSKPFKLCTFSRVSKEKGIEDAIDAVKAINIEDGETMCTLDIYGKIDSDYEIRFSQLQKSFPKYIRYCGCVDANDSVDVLKNYYALLFPTHSKTEGIPGTIVDALCAGIPTIAKEWNSISEIVMHNQTGIAYSSDDSMALAKVIHSALDNREKINSMKVKCLHLADSFSKRVALEVLLSNLI